MNRKLLLIPLLALVVASITYVVTGFLKATYRGNESLYFPQAQSGSPISGSPLSALKLGSGGDPGTVAIAGGALNSPLVGSGAQTAMGILQSRSCALYCIRHLGLDDKWFASEPNEKKRELKAVMRFQGAFDVKIDKTGFLVLSMDGDTPQQCADILRAALQHLNKTSDKLSVNVSTQNRKFIEERVRAAQQEVQAKQDDLVLTMQRSPYSQYEEFQKQYLAVRTDLANAQVDAAAAEAKLAALERDYSQIYAATKGTAPSDVLALNSLSTSLTTLTDELQKRRLQLADVMSQYTKSSPEYKQALSQLQNAEKISRSLVRTGEDIGPGGISPQFAEAKGETAALKKAAAEFGKVFANFTASAQQAPKQFADVERARQEFEAAMTGYTTLRTELEVARIAESRDPSRFEIVDEPYTNDWTPVAPRRLLISGVAFLIALALFSLPFVLKKGEEDDLD